MLLSSILIYALIILSEGEGGAKLLAMARAKFIKSRKSRNPRNFEEIVCSPSWKKERFSRRSGGLGHSGLHFAGSTAKESRAKFQPTEHILIAKFGVSAAENEPTLKPMARSASRADDFFGPLVLIRRNKKHWILAPASINFH